MYGPSFDVNNGEPGGGWVADQRLANQLGRHIEFDAIMLAMFSDKRPQPDEVLLSQGWPDDVLSQWLSKNILSDELLSKAQQHGSIVHRNDHLDACQPLQTFEHILIAAIAVTAPSNSPTPPPLVVRLYGTQRQRLHPRPAADGQPVLALLADQLRSMSRTRDGARNSWT